MKNWHLVIDAERCTGCQNCVMATQDEYLNNDFPGYSRAGAPGVKTLDVKRHDRGSGSMVDALHLPVMCNHCRNAPCLEAATDGEIYRRPDGIIMIDPVKAEGRRDLVETCPYGRIAWNEKENVPQNWNFDAHLLDSGWDRPRAVQCCPTDALEVAYVEDGDMQEKAAKEQLTVMRPDFKTSPRVYYRNPGRFLCHFIGGNVCAGGENLEGADVLLLHGDQELDRTRTDAFGDFKFDGIENGSDGLVLQITHLGHATRFLDITGPVTESRVVSVELG